MPVLQDFFLALLGGICLIVLAVIAVRFFAALRTRHWTETEATIITSEPRRRRPGESGSETIPHIIYEYTAGGEAHRSHQLKPRNVPLGETELPHFLNTYPAGASVQVYYNPANPKEAILEREPLSLSAERLGCLAVFATAVILALAYGLTPLHGLVVRWFPHADDENVLVLTTGLGMYLILFGVMWLRSGVKERRWPAAEGKIVSSKVESFKTFSGGSNATPVTMYRAAVVYAYEVDGRPYHSRQIRREKISGAEALAQGMVAKYPQGSTVRVHYNPSNPADAVVETSPLFGVIVLWSMALLLFAVAASVSGYFHRQ